MGTQSLINNPETLEFDAVSDLRVRLVRGHVDVVGTDGPPRVEVHEIDGDPLVVTHDDGHLEVGYEDLGSVFDFESWSGKEALQGLGEALHDLLHDGRMAQDWAKRFDWFGRRRGEDVGRRDARDQTEGRSVLEAAPGAVPIDTTGLSVDEVVDLIATLVVEARELS